MENNRFRCTRVREVELPTRNNQGDAGLDFYMPTDLTVSDLIKANSKASDIEYTNGLAKEGSFACILNNGKVVKLSIGPKTRVVIPSGIKVLLEPKNSMMMAANKSGRSTKQGLIFTAEICDSPYNGEYHIGIYNTSDRIQGVEAGKAVVQFVHVPCYLDEVEEISNDEYDYEAATWGTRGSNGMGSGNNEKNRDTEDKDIEDKE